MRQIRRGLPRFHGWKICSMGSLNRGATLKAQGEAGAVFFGFDGVDGLAETPSLSARFDWDHSLADRNSRSLFFIGSGG